MGLCINDLLADELLIHILSQLEELSDLLAFAQTCKRWRNLLLDPNDYSWRIAFSTIWTVKAQPNNQNQANSSSSSAAEASESASSSTLNIIRVHPNSWRAEYIERWNQFRRWNQRGSLASSGSSSSGVAGWNALLDPDLVEEGTADENGLLPHAFLSNAVMIPQRNGICTSRISCNYRYRFRWEIISSVEPTATTTTNDNDNDDDGNPAAFVYSSVVSGSKYEWKNFRNPPGYNVIYKRTSKKALAVAAAANNQSVISGEPGSSAAHLPNHQCPPPATSLYLQVMAVKSSNVQAAEDPLIEDSVRLRNCQLNSGKIARNVLDCSVADSTLTCINSDLLDQMVMAYSDGSLLVVSSFDRELTAKESVALDNPKVIFNINSSPHVESNENNKDFFGGAFSMIQVFSEHVEKEKRMDYIGALATCRSKQRFYLFTRSDCETDEWVFAGHTEDFVNREQIECFGLVVNGQTGLAYFICYCGDKLITYSLDFKQRKSLCSSKITALTFVQSLRRIIPVCPHDNSSGIVLMLQNDSNSVYWISLDLTRLDALLLAQFSSLGDRITCLKNRVYSSSDKNSLFVQTVIGDSIGNVNLLIHKQECSHFSPVQELRLRGLGNCPVTCLNLDKLCVVAGDEAGNVLVWDSCSGLLLSKVNTLQSFRSLYKPKLAQKYTNLLYINETILEYSNSRRLLSEAKRSIPRAVYAFDGHLVVVFGRYARYWCFGHNYYSNSNSNQQIQSSGKTSTAVRNHERALGRIRGTDHTSSNSSRPRRSNGGIPSTSSTQQAISAPKAAIETQLKDYEEDRKEEEDWVKRFRRNNGASLAANGANALTEDELIQYATMLSMETAALESIDPMMYEQEEEEEEVIEGEYEEYEYDY